MAFPATTLYGVQSLGRQYVSAKDHFNTKSNTDRNPNTNSLLIDSTQLDSIFCKHTIQKKF